MELPQLRPSTVIDVLDRSVRLVARRPAASVVACARAIVPMTVVGILATWVPLETSVGDVPLPLRSGVLVGVVIASYQLAVAAGTRTMFDTYLGPSMHLGRLRLGPALWVCALVTGGIAIVAGAGAGGASVLVARGADGFAPLAAAAGLVGAVWLWVSWSVAVASWAVDGVGPAASLERSRDLVRPRRVPSFAILASSALVAFAVHVVVDTAAAALGTPARAVAAGLVALAVGPLYAAVVTSLYVDLRVRSDGFPLEADIRRDISTDPWDPYGPNRTRVVPERRDYGQRGPRWER